MESIIIVGGGVMQIPAILTAKDMGLFTIVTDMNPEAEGFAFADLSVTLNTKDIEGHIEFALTHKEKYNIVGAFAGADVARTVAGITNALGLPGVSNEVALLTNNKWEMKKKWLQDGVPTPYAEEVKTYEEALAAVEKIGLPCMVKAIDSAASRGTKRIDSLLELQEAFDMAVHYSSTRTALIETYITGEEQSAETVVYEGRQFQFGIADRHYDMWPLPIETGHTNPSKLPKATQEAIFEVVKKASDSLGITWGPAKADMILTDKGPMILEMPARLSGGFHSQYTTPLSSGQDPIRFVMSLATGRGLDLASAAATKQNVSGCFALFPEPGEVKAIHGLEEALLIEGVVKVIPVVKIGQHIESYKNCADRPIYVILCAENYEALESLLEKVKETIKIETV